MKQSRQSFDRFWTDFFRPFRSVPPVHVESAWEQVLTRLQEDAEDILANARLSAAPALSYQPPFTRRHRIGLTVATALVFAVVLIAVFWPRSLAVVENADGGSYRIVDGKVRRLKVGERLGLNEVIYSNGQSGDTLALRDGSRLEMRSLSELWLEQADDGIRINLTRGGILVDAAKQNASHLYVHTKDAIVSVVGTVFFVNAELEGSRVAVIDGAVRVRQGEMERALLPGQQIATTPFMSLPPLSEEISWSRHVEAHLALLAQATAARRSSSPPVRLRFEAASVRRLEVDGPSERRLYPGNISYINVSFSEFLRLAYNFPSKQISVPRWAYSERYTIVAKAEMPVPESDIKLMLQTLLEERFKMSVHYEERNQSIYALVVAKKGARLQPAADPGARSGGLYENGFLVFRNSSMADLVRVLSEVQTIERPVLDRTGLRGRYDFKIAIDALRPAGAAASGKFNDDGPSVPNASVDSALAGLGLQLDADREAVEFLVIDQVNRIPIEN